MNYVESLKLFGVEVKEIPCICGSGAPTTSTFGAVGCRYMDVYTGDTYRCTAAADQIYIWEIEPRINDEQVNFEHTWSSQKITYEIGKILTQVNTILEATTTE